MTLALTHSEILDVLDMAEVIEVVEQAHAALATGRAYQPDREAVALPNSSALLVPMIATVTPHAAAGIKVLTDAPNNRERGLSVQQTLIVLVDPVTGRYEAVLHGAAITLFRTAAASAVATRHLANSSGGTLGLVGAGAQARAHLKAVRLVRPVDDVLVWSRSRATCDSFVVDMKGHGVSITIADSVEEVVRGADVLCTLTPSREPHVRGEWFQPGQHVNAVGAPPRVDHREIDTAGIVRSRVVVDSRPVAMAESGDVMIPVSERAITREHFSVELGEVIAGLAEGRRAPDEVTLFNSVGLGIQDMATARLVVDKARAKGLGLELDLSL